MLNFILLSIFAWFNIEKQPQNSLQPLKLFPWHDTAIFELPTLEEDLITKNITQTYLQTLNQQSINRDRSLVKDSLRHGIWIQSGWHTLATNQGTTPLPAASLTKIATTLAALNKWGAKHQFVTNVYLTGEVKDGIVTGDLIIEGSGDPLFVWEEAIALGNALNRLGIKEVKGDLLVTDWFYMNYQEQSKKAGELLKQALDIKLWRAEITRQYLQMPTGTPQPEVAIAGKVKTIKHKPDTSKLAIAHQSLPLAEILRQMNIYSNNKMSQMLADLLGGANSIAQAAVDIANFPPQEIELINGSGLGEENRISPRAVVAMLMASDRILKDYSLSATDLYPTASRDLVGTVQNRSLPAGTTVKTGTLDNVSALAGVIPTVSQGNVYFSIINYGRQYQYFRQQQDWLLNQLLQQWQLAPNDFDLAQKENWFLGDPSRNKTNVH